LNSKRGKELLHILALAALADHGAGMQGDYFLKDLSTIQASVFINWHVNSVSRARTKDLVKNLSTWGIPM
jgi:hypothetical protein